ncbi:Dolichyl-phosphate-mannose-protein mannosyltransferase [Asanoa ishikariensis]|uniref:Dolichyl-phosphate-mannose-protein mannosyltransferase n=1 Tax=Asanoa ishikariensis TaxID=137265 RepID=A0A1H3UN97_9ACTN|nr:Dolichyl-phosphate-mannose-protein mannosyltransferase [Asanoa ishikariensis]
MRRTRAVPGLVWLILVLHVAVVLWQTAMFPNFRSPDERQHVDLIVAVERGAAWPWPDPGTLAVTEGSGAGGFTKSNRIDGPLRLADHPLPSRGDRPSYVSHGGNTRDPDQPANQLIQHPPLYYVAGGAALALVPGWDKIPFDLTYLVLRWWNVLFAALLPLILWAVARRLRLPEPIPVVAALVPLAIPELTHTESAVNNDNLLVLLFAVLTFLVVRVLTGDTTRRTALAIGAVGSLALLTKGFALLVPIWVVVAYATVAIRRRSPRVLLTLGVALLATLPGLAWWVRNRIVYGSVQPHGRFTEVPTLTATHSFGDGGLTWLARLLERMNTLFFVHDQTGDRLHHWPWKLAILAALVVAAGIVLTLVLGAVPRTTALVLLVPVVGLLAIVAKGSYEQWAATQTYAGMQGRYLYGGLVGLAVVAVAAASRLPDRWRRATPLAVLLGAVVMQAVYFGYTLDLFWTPADGNRLAAFRAIFDWYAMPPVVLALVVLVAVAALVWLLVAMVRLAFRAPLVPAVAGPSLSLPTQKAAPAVESEDRVQI